MSQADNVDHHHHHLGSISTPPFPIEIRERSTEEASSLTEKKTSAESA